MGDVDPIEVSVPSGVSSDEAERLLAAGMSEALHKGLPPQVWAEIKRERARRLAPVQMARKGDTT